MNIKVLTNNHFSANCYIVYDEQAKEGIVIDPTVAYSTVQNDPILSQICFKYILLTHCHYDHLLCYEEWREKTSCQTAIGRGDVEGLLDSAINLSPLLTYKSKTFPEAEIMLSEGDSLCFGGYTLSALHTPGHTKGSMCYRINDTLFSGDTLFAEGGVGRTDFPTGNGFQLMQSIKRLLELPDGTVVYPGHGASTTVGAERQYHVE